MDFSMHVDNTDSADIRDLLSLVNRPPTQISVPTLSKKHETENETTPHTSNGVSILSDELQTEPNSVAHVDESGKHLLEHGPSGHPISSQIKETSVSDRKSLSSAFSNHLFWPSSAKCQ